MAQQVNVRDRHRIVSTCAVYRTRPDGRHEYLIMKRSEALPVYPGLWTVPGGGLDRDDYETTPKTSPDGWEVPLEISTRRETKEETGVEVGPLEYISHFTFIRKKDDVPVFGVRFAAQYLSGEVTLDPEDSTESTWATVDEIGNYNFLGDIARELRELDAVLTSRA